MGYRNALCCLLGDDCVRLFSRIQHCADEERDPGLAVDQHIDEGAVQIDLLRVLDGGLVACLYQRSRAGAGAGLIDGDESLMAQEGKKDTSLSRIQAPDVEGSCLE